jgi:predicted transcriptional regulator
MNTNDELLVERLNEMVFLLAIIAKRGVRQLDLIHELGDSGFGPKRIAELVGTSPNTVSVALHKKRHQSRKKGKRG